MITDLLLGLADICSPVVLAPCLGNSRSTNWV